jgi:hypothetical protein
MNKKFTIGLIAMVAILGGGALAATKLTHAQSSTLPTTAPTTQGDIKTAGDTDNIQDPGGIEKPDTVSSTTTTNDTQTGEHESGNDSDGGANEDSN